MSSAAHLSTLQIISHIKVMIMKFFIDFLLITGTCTWGLNGCEGVIERLLSKVDVS